MFFTSLIWLILSRILSHWQVFKILTESNFWLGVHVLDILELLKPITKPLEIGKLLIFE